MNSHKLTAALSDRSDHKDFDRLLEESSLGAAAAKKNQVDTPIEVYGQVQDRLRDSGVECRREDVDDFLLHLVRLYSVSNHTESTSSAPVNTAFSNKLWMPQHGFRWRGDSSEASPDSVVRSLWERRENSSWNIVDLAYRVRTDVVQDIVQSLLNKKVFSYLRQDVARSMVSLCFNSRTPLPLVILNACASAVPASSVRDELADAFMNMMPTERTVLLTGSRLTRGEEPRARRRAQQDLIMTIPKIGVGVTTQSPRAQLPRPQDQTSVSDLLSRACDRDPRAWEEIVHRYRGVVIAKARSFGLQDADAHDAVRMTWLRLAENCHRIQLPDQLAGWLATTTSRECLHILRRQTQHTPAPAHVVAERLADPSAGPGQHTIDADTAALLWRLVATLSPRRQILLRELFFDSPRPYSEVARNTGIPAGGIGPTRARALTKLRRKLDERRSGTEQPLPVYGHTRWSGDDVSPPDDQSLAAATFRTWITSWACQIMLLHDQDDQIREEAWSREGQRLTTALNDALVVIGGHDREVRKVAEDNNEFRRQMSERAERLLS